MAVSATIPNAQDLATWLNVSPRGLLIYGEEVRPVAIKTIVKGYSETRNDFLFERRLNDFLFPVIIEHSKNRPSLVFCRSCKNKANRKALFVQYSQRNVRYGASFDSTDFVSCTNVNGNDIRSRWIAESTIDGARQKGIQQTTAAMSSSWNCFSSCWNGCIRSIFGRDGFRTTRYSSKTFL